MIRVPYIQRKEEVSHAAQLRQARKEAERARKQRGKGGVRDGHGLQGRGANLVPEVKAVRREMEGKRGR